MARFYGEVGYGEPVETAPGVWDFDITERSYFGDIERKSRTLQESENIHDDIAVNHSISIVADEHAIKHFTKIKYVRWSGVEWTVTSVDVRHPRLILSLGSVYNGPTAET